MYHPIRRVKDFAEALRLAITTFQRLGFALWTALDRQRAAIEANTASNAELLTAVKAVEAATEATAKAAQYLAAIEKHRQETAGPAFRLWVASMSKPEIPTLHFHLPPLGTKEIVENVMYGKGGWKTLQQTAIEDEAMKRARKMAERYEMTPIPRPEFDEENWHP